MVAVTNTVKLYFEKGIEGIISLINSGNARRKYDGRSEAHIIKVACSPASERHSRWMLRLLEA